MAKKMKKLLERVEAIEAEIKALRETAEKNVTTISAGIEKLVAGAPAKSTRKAATKKKTTAPVEKAVAKPEVKAEPENKPEVKTTPEVKAEKPARKPRAAKKPVVQKEAAPEQIVEKPAQEVEKKEPEPKPTRTRKPKAAAPRTARASFVLYNCDEAKTPESKYNRNDEIFSDSQKGRRGLWNKLKAEMAEGRIELLDNYPIRNVRVEIQSGNPESVSQHLKYGLIEKVE